MAKVKFGMMMTDARGKLGGQVFSKNRSGSYVRTKVTPVNPQTSFQATVRAIFGAISAAWSALTPAQILSWNGAVGDWLTTDVFGDSIKPSGKNLHHRLNQNAQLAGYSALTLPPAKVEVPDEIVSEVDIDPGVGDALTLTGAYTGADATVVVEATAPLTEGTTFVKDKLRVIYRAVGNAYSDSDAMAAYEAKFGEPADGANVYIGVKYVTPTGQTSTRQIVKATVLAT